MQKIGLTLGPVLFNWDADRLRAFYKGIAENSKFDRVHLCEVVCGKRTPFTDAVWADAIERLEAAGKVAVLSTLALPASQRERKTVTDLCRDGTLVEMNDVTALPARASAVRGWAAGQCLQRACGAIPGGAWRRDALHARGTAADLRGGDRARLPGA